MLFRKHRKPFQLPDYNVVAYHKYNWKNEEIGETNLIESCEERSVVRDTASLQICASRDSFQVSVEDSFRETEIAL